MKTVIEMADEIFDRQGPDTHCREPYWTATDAELERFAELIRAEEREACAKLADKVEYRGACESDVAMAIRAVGSRAVGNRAYDRYEGDNT